MSDPILDFNDWLIKKENAINETKENEADKIHLFTKIIIKKELKWRIRNFLDQSNITERMLFPGSDGLADWLKRHYGKRPPEI